MAYNSRILREALKARSLTHGKLSQRLGISPADLERELRSFEPSQSLLTDIARELSLPPFAFYMTRTPPLHEAIPDFRSSNPAPRTKSRQTIDSIQFAEGVQNAVKADSEVVRDLPRLADVRGGDVDTFAFQAREYFEISFKDQKDAKDAKAFYLICRRRIEDKGIFVLHDTFPEQDGSGFCLSDPANPIIVINTKK